MSQQVGPEHEAKHKLTEWLEDHGAAVWWEESNPWGYDQFTIERDAAAGGIPDLLIEIGGRKFVVEFKHGDSAGEVYSAKLQLIGYWFEHVAHDQTYFAGDRAVPIDGFLTATKHSRFGRLFASWKEGELQTLEDMDEGRASCYEYGQLPPAEYPMTEQHIRTLWRMAQQREENINGVSNTPHVGSLLSDHLERQRFDPNPAVLWNKGRSNQDWEVLD